MQMEDKLINFEIYKNENEEFHWFNEPNNEFSSSKNFVGFESAIVNPTMQAPLSNYSSKTPNTNIIVTIKKEKEANFIQNMVDSGVRVFRINGAYFTYNEYKEKVEEIKRCVRQADPNYVPTIIYDLKGPIPRITKLDQYGTSVLKELKKGQVIKLAYEQTRCNDPNVLSVDKKIHEAVNKGDTLIIDSKVTLKVISLEEANTNSKKFDYFHIKSISSENLNLLECQKEKKLIEKEILSKYKINEDKFDRDDFFSKDRKIFSNDYSKTKETLRKENTNDSKSKFPSVFDFEFHEKVKQQSKNIESEFQKLMKIQKTFEDEQADRKFSLQVKEKEVRIRPLKRSNSELLLNYSMKDISTNSRFESFCFSKEESAYDEFPHSKKQKNFSVRDIKIPNDSLDVDLDQATSPDQLKSKSGKFHKVRSFMDRRNVNSNKSYKSDYDLTEEKSRLEDKKNYAKTLKIFNKDEDRENEYYVNQLNFKQDTQTKRANKSSKNKGLYKLTSNSSKLNLSNKINYKTIRFKRESLKANSYTTLHKHNFNPNATKRTVICEVEIPGKIHIFSKIFLLEKDIIKYLNIPIIGVKDIVDLNKMSKLGINIVCAMVTKGSDVDEIRELIEDKSNDIKIFSRIDTNDSIYNFDDILSKSDGIVLNQGVLSTKIPCQDLCLVETYIIERCKIKQMPLFLQTNILNSISKKIIPSFTDLSSIDFAVMAGVDGIILKEETTLSDHHSEIIRNLTEILFQMESLGEKKKHFDEITKIYKINREYISVLNHGNIQLDSIFESAVKMSFDLLASYIVLFTDNYKYAKFLSKYQPDCKIFCVTNDFCHHSYMNLCRGVVAYYTQKSDISSFNDELMSEVLEFAGGKVKLKNASLIILINAFSESKNKNKNGIMCKFLNG